jgi:hypothetical protein
MTKCSTLASVADRAVSIIRSFEFRACFGFRISDFGFLIRSGAALAVVLVSLLASGCGAIDPTIPFRRQLIEANSRIDHVEADNLELHAQLARQDEQVRTLQALGEGKRIEKLYTVKRIELGDRSGGVSLDEKTGDSGVKVYIEPIDQYGSSIKAPGEVTVELYDLAAPPAENLVATSRFGVEEVGKKWVNGFLTQQYVFECPWGSNPPRHNQLTIRVKFVDYLTGQSFAEQKVVTVTLRPTTQPATSSAPSPAATKGPGLTTLPSLPPTTTSAATEPMRPSQPPAPTSPMPATSTQTTTSPAILAPVVVPPAPVVVPPAAPATVVTPVVPAPAPVVPAPAPATQSTGWMPAPTSQTQPAPDAVVPPRNSP